MSGKYKFSFDIWSLLLFLVVMLPTFIWLALPPPNDILRRESITKSLDMVASICQVCMIVILCFFKNTECEKIRFTPFIVITVFCCLLYFACWVFYYAGIVNVFVIVGLTIPPCLAFLFFAIDRKNNVALIPVLIFTVCHFVHAMVNFIG